MHRDIKPANVMLNREGTVKILDFGIAKMLQGSQTGMLMGMPSTSNEMVTFGQVDHRADIFNFGLVLYDSR